MTRVTAHEGATGAGVSTPGGFLRLIGIATTVLLDFPAARRKLLKVES
jgi:hypothetical protein